MHMMYLALLLLVASIYSRFKVNNIDFNYENQSLNQISDVIQLDPALAYS